MADKRNVHTVKVEDGWAGRRAGSDRTGKPYPTKAEAEAANRATARRDGVEHIPHRRDGTIGERRSYGNDPNPPKDKR